MLLTFPQTRSLLEKYGLPLVSTVVTRDLGQALVAARKVGYPIVLKATGASINHKTEKGLVFTGIWTDGELRQNFFQLNKAVRSVGDAGVFYLVQKQLSGAELIIGGKRDPAFGPVILFGTGGIYAELLDDVAIRVCPIGREDARQMLYETHAKKFIAGFRSRKMGEEPMVGLLLKAARMMMENDWICEFDFNPVIAGEAGATIVDARVAVQ